MGDFWPKFSKSENLPKLPGFRSLGVRGLKKFRFLLQKARPCANPRRLSHFAWKSVEGSDLQVSWGKKNKDPPLEWEVAVNTVLRYRVLCDKLYKFSVGCMVELDALSDSCSLLEKDLRSSTVQQQLQWQPGAGDQEACRWCGECEEAFLISYCILMLCHNTTVWCKICTCAQWRRKGLTFTCGLYVLLFLTYILYVLACCAGLIFTYSDI